MSVKEKEKTSMSGRIFQLILRLKIVQGCVLMCYTVKRPFFFAPRAENESLPG